MYRKALPKKRALAFASPSLAILAVLCLLAFLLAGAAAAQPANPAEERRLLEEATRRLLAADIELSGELRDGADRSLQGVEARVEIQFYDASLPRLARSESRVAIVDGYFRFSCQSCMGIRASFSRQGYQRQTLEVDYSETDQNPAAGQTPRVVKRQKVVLREQGNPVRLERFQGRLVVREGGDEEVLPVGDQASGGPAPLQIVPKDAKGGALPFVRLRVGREGESIATRELAGKAAVKAPAAPRIDFGNAGGVVRYQPQARDLRQIRYEMREAPAEGYSSELALDPESGEVVYFFCKVGNLYGRGSATPAMVEETGQGRRVVAHLEIELNPDGSRNLETLQ